MKNTLAVLMICFSSLAFAGTSVNKQAKQAKAHHGPPSSYRAPIFRFMRR